MKPQKLVIPQKTLMVKTNHDDPVFFHYYPYSRYVYRKRLSNSLKLIGELRFEKLLEVGYGSGIFLPALSKLARHVTALDIHNELAQVKKMLDRCKVSSVHLVSGDIMAMPFSDNEFDALVIVSTLENIPDSARAVKELRRVVRPNGHLFISFPVENIITDTFFRLVGENPDELHPSNHRYILDFLSGNFKIERILKFPPLLPVDLTLYISVHCINTLP